MPLRWSQESGISGLAIMGSSSGIFSMWTGRSVEEHEIHNYVANLNQS